ncbi:Erythromycin esterase homolog [Gillisia sp. Hel1_33_143]|uniref:erythromycin esterase family protein n=1 Tax=Gillisia sp. Hel1_33_143 TaxID=1336796 RepID=UPI00087CEF71|nr:erythromycin esterase family protein [Gillisia sp. Hel1_33_143]SDS69244.1 Erythromycin esterase homolog [Gillisia sp. Hel1_33_143]
MRLYSTILVITFLSSLKIFSQAVHISDCEAMFNSESFSFEADNLKGLDTNISYIVDENYKVNLDTTHFFDGSRSLRIDGYQENVKTFATLSLKVPLKVKKGAAIKLSVWVKTHALQGENSGAMLRLMGYNDIKGANPSIFKFNDQPLKGTVNWTLVSIATIANEDLNYLILSGLMQGKGNAWFDNFKIKIDEEEVKEILFFKNSSEAIEIEKSLSEYVSPLDLESIENVGISISQQNADCRVIGIGEATHGTKEIFLFKIAIIKSLIKNNNVRSIALESYYANTEELNKYIITGKGDSKKLIANLKFWNYYTEDFLAFIEWLQEYNKQTENKVSITGVDSQSGGNSLQILLEEFKNDPPTTELLNQLNSDSIELTKKIEISQRLFDQIVSKEQEESISNNSRILKNSYFLDQYSGLEYSKVRDSLMALNIELVDHKLTPKEKIVYWAHDLHIQKKAGWTGGFLTEIFADNYINLGFLLGSGQFTAIDKENGKLDSNNILSLMKCNSLESLMDVYKFPVLLFNNKSASKNAYLKDQLFNKYLEKRSIGALEINEQFRLLDGNTSDLYDFFIYIKNSNPSKLLEKK